MKKTIALALCALLALTALAGCGQAAEAEVQLDELAFQIRDSVESSEELYLLDEGIARELFGAPEDAQCVAWAGAGATAEELAVFELADAEAAGALLDALRARNAEREESYAGYLPDEVPKLQNTLLLSNGRYVLLCTAPDTAGARSAWDEAFEG